MPEQKPLSRSNFGSVAILNIAESGSFSSDRTITEYCSIVIQSHPT